MKKTIFVTLIAASIAAGCVTAWAAPPNTVKVTPFGVDYPLMRPLPYPSREADPFERSFGVRRWFNPVGQETNDYERAVTAALEMFELYGGYGVLGHGEAVFTNAAARWRRVHRGR
jgi:hypothetical protein